MRYIKTYEKFTKEPQIGDYVAVKIPRMIKYVLGRPNLDLNQIYFAKVVNKEGGIFGVEFGDDFYNFTKKWWMMRDEIIDFSKNKEDLEYLIIADKYNL